LLKESKFCKCGCGNQIEWKEHHKYKGMPDYIHGHKQTDTYSGKTMVANVEGLI
jgi:hypothetical protein